LNCAAVQIKNLIHTTDLDRVRNEQPTVWSVGANLVGKSTDHPQRRNGGNVSHKIESVFSAVEMAALRQSTEEAAVKLLAGARAFLIIGRDAKSIFFATLLFRLQLQSSWDVDTLATDGRLLHYNPEFVTELSLDELVGVLAHEVMHCALAHPFRRGARDLILWNIACDLAINPILRDAKITLPESRLMPGEGTFADLQPGKSAEEYYATLRRAKDDGNEGDEVPEHETLDPGGCGQVIDASEGDPATTQAAAAEWKVALVQAQEAAKGRGELPSGLGRTIEDVVNPPVDWRSVLREFVASTAKNDYSWVRPNRRFLAQGMYLPGLHSEELGDVILAVDTSGSIDEKMLGQFASEVNAVKSAYDCSVTVLYHDTEIQKVQSWRSADGPLVLDPVGGGGTNHTCIFEWIDREGTNPACVICLTDLETEFPAAFNAAPVLWAVIGDCPTTPPFGQVVHIAP
jgi:predicted metal-dependent peptidase